MDTYTAVWHQSAEEDLAELWGSSLAPNAIARAADTIDAKLRIDAELKGGSIGEENRLIYKYPLQVLYRVRQLDRIVEVLRLRLDVSAG